MHARTPVAARNSASPPRRFGHSSVIPAMVPSPPLPSHLRTQLCARQVRSVSAARYHATSESAMTCVLHAHRSRMRHSRMPLPPPASAATSAAATTRTNAGDVDAAGQADEGASELATHSAPNEDAVFARPAQLLPHAYHAGDGAPRASAAAVASDMAHASAGFRKLWAAKLADRLAGIDAERSELGSSIEELRTQLLFLQLHQKSSVRARVAHEAASDARARTADSQRGMVPLRVQAGKPPALRPPSGDARSRPQSVPSDEPSAELSLVVPLVPRDDGTPMLVLTSDDDARAAVDEASGVEPAPS